MLYLNQSFLFSSWGDLNLTLTSVVFEFKDGSNINATAQDLTLTSVVFE